MARSINVFVAGGYDPADPEALDRDPETISEFGEALGREVARQGHLLLNGCQTHFDRDLAKGAAAYLDSERRSEDADKHIRCYVPETVEPIHNHGCVMESSLESWDLGRRSLLAPEVVRDADAVVLVGGFLGTFKAANWARVLHRPILAFTTFGGAAEEIYEVEVATHAHHMDADTRFRHEKVLKSRSADWLELAAATVELCERRAVSRNVFVIMSFENAAEFDNVHKCIKSVAKEFDYDAARVDESNRLNRIIPEIMRQIDECAFVIADISEASPNVYYEVGYAEGVDKQIVFTARVGTQLPFDVRDTPVIFYNSFAELKELLRPSIRHISMGHGRSRF